VLVDAPSVGEALLAPLAALEGHWLEVTCSGCGTMTQYPLRLMALRIGGVRVLGEVVPRLVCKRASCRARPESDWLCKTPNRTFNYGAEPGWSVRLDQRVSRAG